MAGNTRRNTVQNVVAGEMGVFERLELWASTTRRLHDALRRATMAAELAEVLWAKMSEEQRRALADDAQIGYLIRQMTSAGYGFV